LLYAYSNTTAATSCESTKKLHTADLTSWLYNSIFECKSRINSKHLRLKILKTLRTACLNSKFTGSYKKSVTTIYDAK